jgi:hypothetical protein
VLFRVRLVAECASFATPWGAISRTAPDRYRNPREIQRSSRTARDRPRFPRLIQRSSASDRFGTRLSDGTFLPHCPSRPATWRGERYPLARTPSQRRAARTPSAPQRRGRRATRGGADAERPAAARTPSNPQRRGRRPPRGGADAAGAGRGRLAARWCGRRAARGGPRRRRAPRASPPIARIRPPGALDPPHIAQKRAILSDVRPVCFVERSS